MAIVNVVQKGSVVYVYGERNRLLFTKSGGRAPGDGVKGYTGGAVSIQLGSVIYTYNERGMVIGTKSA